MKIAIVTPVFNDWLALDLLVQKIQGLYADKYEIHYYAVDDGSSSTQVPKSLSETVNFNIIQLTRNLGHQRAIVIGLCHVSENFSGDGVVVMDSDGEDRPEDIQALIDALERKEKIVFASRSERQESFLFKFLYYWYKFTFRMLTSQKISFGNFCIVPQSSLKKLVYMSEIWNHFSGGVIRSRLSYKEVPLPRGKRLEGQSKMNLTSLIIHGISSISLYLDVVATRLLLLSLGLIAFCGMVFTVILYYRFFTELAIPGWATYTSIGLVVIVMQNFFSALILVFLVLFYRSQGLFVPIDNYKTFINRVISGGSKND